jgi:hypothetical protein
MTMQTNPNVRTRLLDPTSFHALELAPELVLGTVTACSAMRLKMTLHFGQRGVLAAQFLVARQSRTEIVSSRR